MNTDDTRQQLASLLLARHEWEQEASLARAAIRQLDRQIAELDALLDADDTVWPPEPTLPPTTYDATYAADDGLCGKVLQTSQLCARGRGHDLAPGPSAQRHRSRAALDRKNERRREARAGRRGGAS